MYPCDLKALANLRNVNIWSYKVKNKRLSQNCFQVKSFMSPSDLLILTASLLFLTALVTKVVALPSLVSILDGDKVHVIQREYVIIKFSHLGETMN